MVTVAIAAVLALTGLARAEPPAAASDVVAVGARVTGYDAEFVTSVKVGLEMMYARDYRAARSHFEAMELAYPGCALGPIADALVWQALMVENYDFRYDKQFWTSAKRARVALDAALKSPGHEGWEHFLYAGLAGVEAMHLARQESYLNALTVAFDAMEHAGRARELVPEFPDLVLADGIYNYWRTVITKGSRVLPDFGDHRPEGLEQMRTAETSGVFMSQPATLALAFSYYEGKNYSAALAACEKNRARYPENILNNELMGRVYTSVRKYDEALGVFDDILRVAPENKRVHYYKGVTLLRANRATEAEKELLTYLAYPDLVTWQKSGTHYRLGQVYYRLKLYAKAEEQWKSAVALDGHSGSKARLERLREAREQGKIP